MAWGASERKFLILLAVVLASALTWRSAHSVAESPALLPSLRVDANSAPIEVLGALPGLGPALSGRIVAIREVAPFRSLDDLDRRVKGIGPAKVAAIRPFLSFDSASVQKP